MSDPTGEATTHGHRALLNAMCCGALADDEDADLDASVALLRMDGARSAAGSARSRFSATPAAPLTAALGSDGSEMPSRSFSAQTATSSSAAASAVDASLSRDRGAGGWGDSRRTQQHHHHQHRDGTAADPRDAAHAAPEEATNVFRFSREASSASDSDGDFAQQALSPRDATAAAAAATSVTAGRRRQRSDSDSMGLPSHSRGEQHAHRSHRAGPGPSPPIRAREMVRVTMPVISLTAADAADDASVPEAPHGSAPSEDAALRPQPADQHQTQPREPPQQPPQQNGGRWMMKLRVGRDAGSTPAGAAPLSTANAAAAAAPPPSLQQPQQHSPPAPASKAMFSFSQRKIVHVPVGGGGGGVASGSEARGASVSSIFTDSAASLVSTPTTVPSLARGSMGAFPAAVGSGAMPHARLGADLAGNGDAAATGSAWPALGGSRGSSLTLSDRGSSVGGGGAGASSLASSSLARGVGSLHVGPSPQTLRQPAVDYDAAPPPLTLPVLAPLQRCWESLYREVSAISEGTYGVVYDAVHVASGDRVAAKRLKFIEQLDGFPVTSVREIWVLRHLASLSAEKRRFFSVIRDIVMSRSFTDTYLVFDFVEHSLHGLLARQAHTGAAWSVGAWRHVLLQVCEGVARLHALGIVHRDIKTNNVLVGRDGGVQLCDFGLAISADIERDRMTPRVIALAFRPPEMLLGMGAYDDRVDVWSVGCLIVNVVSGAPPFCPPADPRTSNRGAQNKAQSELEQLVLISQRLAVPVAAMMSPETRARCKAHDMIAEQAAKLRGPGGAHHGALSHRRPAGGGGGGAGADAPDSLRHAVILPGRSAPSNDAFERWLRTQHDGYQLWLRQQQQRRAQEQLHEQQQQHRQAFSAFGDSSAAAAPRMDDALVDLVVWMLQPDPARRPRMAQVMEHPYMVGARRDAPSALVALQQQLAALGSDARLH
jgi:serine/threonine protein kinase